MEGSRRWRISPSDTRRPVIGLVAAGVAGEEEDRRRPRQKGRLDPQPAVLPGLRSWTGTRQSTTAELLERSARQGEVGSRGYDGERRWSCSVVEENGRESEREGPVELGLAGGSTTTL